jgi:hypothetical protein
LISLARPNALQNLHMTNPKKQRRRPRQVVHSRLDLEIFSRLKAYAARTGAEDSAVVNAALAQYLDKSSDTALILRRLDRMTRRMGRVQRELDGVAEFVTTWVQMWFAHTPQLTPEARKTAQQSAARRYAEMLDFIRKRITGPKRFLVDLLGPEEPDAPRTSGGGPQGVPDDVPQ